MLQKLAEASNSYMRADECDERARQAPDETLRASYLQLSRDWRRLAKSYEFTASLERFVLYAENGWPIRLVDLPRPPKEE